MTWREKSSVSRADLAHLLGHEAGGAVHGQRVDLRAAGGLQPAGTLEWVVHGAPGLSVADARVQEGDDAVLEFRVTLSRASVSTVTVDYATSDVSARAGEDYTAASDTLSFAPGETEKTVPVAVINDGHNEVEETMTLTLSHASGGNAYIADATATGAEVWRGATPYKTYANPMTYRAQSGRQFVVIATGRGADAALVTFARPR